MEIMVQYICLVACICFGAILAHTWSLSPLVSDYIYGMSREGALMS